jgi:serine/threonine-protein kinase
LNGDELKIGDLLDSRYRIVALLGQGGMGSVYRAEHVAIRRPVAIKVLHPDFAGDPDHGKRFQREAFVTGRADHPNCVTVSDFGALEAGGFYLVMELVDGVGLADLLAREERLPARRALHIARHILRGLAHAHAAGVVHRDIKPSNIILARSGDDPDFAKLLDFGIAKLVEGAATPAPAPVDQHITRIGTAVGTPTYVAPEQAVGGAADPRSDLYSLSVVLFEMIAGRPPFRAEETIKLLAMHLSTPVPAMAELVPGLCVAPAVEELIRVGLAKEAASRHASAATYAAAIDDLFARDLVDAPSGIASSAVPAPSPGPPRGLLRRRKRVAGAAGALALLIIIMVAAGDRGGVGPGRPEMSGMLVPTGLVAAAPDSTAEDARQELALGHDEIAARSPLEALEAYRRAVALDPEVADDPDLRKNAEAQLQARDS